MESIREGSVDVIGVTRGDDSGDVKVGVVLVEVGFTSSYS